MNDATWQCYCRANPIPLGQDCPSCGWDGQDDAEAASLGWRRVYTVERERGALEARLASWDEKWEAKFAECHAAEARAEALAALVRWAWERLSAAPTLGTKAHQHVDHVTFRLRAALAPDESEGARAETLDEFRMRLHHAHTSADQIIEYWYKDKRERDEWKARAAEAERARDEWKRIAMIEDDDELVAAASERADALEARAERLAEALRKCLGSEAADEAFDGRRDRDLEAWLAVADGWEQARAALAAEESEGTK